MRARLWAWWHRKFLGHEMEMLNRLYTLHGGYVMFVVYRCGCGGRKTRVI